MDAPTPNLFGYSLQYTISNYEKFKEMPLQMQQAILMNADKFEKLEGSHFLSPEELETQLGGTTRTWRQFLILKPVRDYIARRTSEDIEIMNRQALYKQFVKAAQAGDNAAAKYLKDLNEANSTQTNQQVVILHYIPRPTRESSSGQ